MLRGADLDPTHTAPVRAPTTRLDIAHAVRLLRAAPASPNPGIHADPGGHGVRRDRPGRRRAPYHRLPRGTPTPA